MNVDMVVNPILPEHMWISVWTIQKSNPAINTHQKMNRMDHVSHQSQECGH